MAAGETGEGEVQIVVLSHPSARTRCHSTRYFTVTMDELLVKKDVHYPPLSDKTGITTAKLGNCDRGLSDCFFLSSDVIPGQAYILVIYFSI